MTTRLHLLLLALGVASGCTSAPIRMEDTTPPAPDRIAAPAILVGSSGPLPGYAIVTIARATHLFGNPCYYDIFIDDVLAVRLLPSEGIRAQLAAGPRRIRLETGSFLCDKFSTGAVLDVVVGRRHQVRVGLFESRPALSVSSEAQQ